MTRENKVGIVLSVSFLTLVGVVVHHRMRSPVADDADNEKSTQVAELTTPTGDASAPREAPKEKSATDEPLSISGSSTASESAPQAFPRTIQPVALTTAEGDKKDPPANGGGSIAPPSAPPSVPVVTTLPSPPTQTPEPAVAPAKPETKPMTPDFRALPSGDKSTTAEPPPAAKKDTPEAKPAPQSGPPSLEIPLNDPKAKPMPVTPVDKSGEKIALPGPEKFGVAGSPPPGPGDLELPKPVMPPAVAAPVGVTGPATVPPQGTPPIPAGAAPMLEPKPVPLLSSALPRTDPLPQGGTPEPVPPARPSFPTGPTPVTPTSPSSDGRASEFIPAPEGPSALRPGRAPQAPIPLADPRLRLGTGGGPSNPAPIPAPARGTAIGLAPPVAAGSARSADVESWVEEVYVVQSGENFASISNRKYQTDKYGPALEAFNRAHPRVRDELQRLGLVAELRIVIPPTYLLEKRHGALIPGLTPPTAGAGTVPQGPIPLPGAVAPVTSPPAPIPGVGPLPAPAPVPGTGSSAGPGSGAASSTVRSSRYLVRSRAEHVREIAGVTLNNRDRWAEIAELNRGIDPVYPVPAGTVLSLPGDARVPATNLAQ